MKKVFLLFLVCLVTIPSALSQRIMMVTENSEVEVEGSGFLSDWLRGQGYIVDVDQGAPGASEFAGELTQEEIDRLNSYDVVFVNRSISSGNFNSPTIFLAWNEDVKAPLFLGSAYLARNSRWFWIDGGQQRTNLWNGVDIVEANHPVVAGLTGEFFDIPLGIDHITPGDVGQGTVIATILNAASEDANAIVAWEPGQEFAAAGAYIAGGARLFFPIYRYHEANGFGNAADTTDGDFPNYTENGLKLIKQGIDWLHSFNANSGNPVENWDLY